LISLTRRRITPRLLSKATVVRRVCSSKMPPSYRKYDYHRSDASGALGRDRECSPYHTSQAALRLGPVEQLGNLTELNRCTTSQLVVRPLTCRVSGIDSLGSAPPPKPASIRPDAGLGSCAHPELTDWLALHLSRLLDKHAPSSAISSHAIIRFARSHDTPTTGPGFVDGFCQTS
jgi:hypothetical protein